MCPLPTRSGLFYLCHIQHCAHVATQDVQPSYRMGDANNIGKRWLSHAIQRRKDYITCVHGRTGDEDNWLRIPGVLIA